MKAITLTEPYATLVAYRWKAYETRAWRTSHRGPLAIHAAKTFQGVGGKRGFEQVLRDLHPGLQVRLAEVTGRTEDPATWPLGKVLAVTWIEDCIPTDSLRDELRESDEELGWWESEVGDYSDGRWAWELRDPIMVTPIPYRGAQGLWTLPDEAIPENVRRANAVPA
jgi:hypothetical protein